MYELVFHTTSGASWSRPPSTCLKCRYRTFILHHNYNYNSNYYSYNYHYTTLSLHYNYKYTTLHHTTSSSCGWGYHCNHSKKHNSNHLLVHQWVRSASQASQQPHFPRGFLSLKLPPPAPLIYKAYPASSWQFIISPINMVIDPHVQRICSSLFNIVHLFSVQYCPSIFPINLASQTWSFSFPRCPHLQKQTNDVEGFWPGPSIAPGRKVFAMTQRIWRMADQPCTGESRYGPIPERFGWYRMTRFIHGPWTVERYGNVGTIETFPKLEIPDFRRNLKMAGDTYMGISIHHGAFVDKQLLPSIPRASWDSKRHLMGIPRILRQITQHHESISYK